MIETGIKGHKEQIVTPEMSAARVGSGLVDVFATPMLVALVEQTCYESVLPHLDEAIRARPRYSLRGWATSS